MNHSDFINFIVNQKCIICHFILNTLIFTYKLHSMPFFQAKSPFVLYKQRYIPVFCAITLNIYSINNRGVTSAGAYIELLERKKGKSERKLEFKGIFQLLLCLLLVVDKFKNIKRIDRFKQIARYIDRQIVLTVGFENKNRKLPIIIQTIVFYHYLSIYLSIWFVNTITNKIHIFCKINKVYS